MSEALRCDFCAFECLIKPGDTGLCGVRKNVNGTIRTLSYGHMVAMATDPVEKKPLYHFLPGTQIFSIALYGCNFRCAFCQNAEIAMPEYQSKLRSAYVSPEEAVAAWQRSGTPAIAFTYGEPSMWQDYLIEVAQGVAEQGGKTVMVTNGFFSPAARTRLLGVIDAFNIDLKGNDQFYRRLCRGRHDPVIETISELAPRAHVEVTTMIIGDVHTPAEIDRLGDELAAAGVQVWHLSRFHPAFKMMDHPSTGEERLQDALERQRERLPIPFIYGGNSRQLEYQQTHCPRCGTLCVERSVMRATRIRAEHGRCPSCGYELYGTYDL